MACCYDPASPDHMADRSRNFTKHTTYQPKYWSWFDMRVFYVRVSNCEVDKSTPEFLTLNHIPQNPDTLLEVNGGKRSIYSDSVSSLLRRDKIDKKSEEVTFVSTDNIRMTGSVRFEVYIRDDLLLSGVLDMCNSNGYVGELKGHSKRWSMNCQSATSPTSLGFLRGKQYAPGTDSASPTVEVYVAGCFSGTPVILTKTLQLNLRRKNARKGTLDSIPENQTTNTKTDTPSENSLQMSEFQEYKVENDDDEDDYNSINSRADYIESEDGELSWFNAGVRVGVGIGLGICLGVGIGVGLLVRTYQATTGNFKRRLM